jgi:hypothetical protein
MEFIEFTDALEGSAAVKGLVVPEATPATALDLADAIKLIRPEGEELLIVSADHALATLVVQMTHLAAQNKLIATRLVDAMLAPGSPVSPASARQAQRNAEARKELIDEFGLRESDGKDLRSQPPGCPGVSGLPIRHGRPPSAGDRQSARGVRAIWS